ncbi:hypothetical protein K503DRAFT_769779 [Rhizopogon vinicolor AM-OR11-026]|uniref:Uncharacterized protein n=1 Tax=Rhizopogon vinicolor AM-OR11-026 TaxID=1314800 RepID=A0A1B7N2Q8_9AGAM|nr:hypothetical protein K503DRAFT_769779 [Rhizopogon vinicolor AM-OR11-026]
MSRGELRGWVGNLAASDSEGLEYECNYVAVAKNPGNTISSKKVIQERAKDKGVEGGEKKS